MPTIPKVYPIKNVRLGELPVKTIVPITAKTETQALEQARILAHHADVDIVEFRIDLLEIAQDIVSNNPKIMALGEQLNEILQKPLIATIRTANEGGNLTITDNDYATVYQQYLAKPFMQLLDIEMFRAPSIVENLVKRAHDNNVLVIMSNHDFAKTPPQATIEQRLLTQDSLRADILKIAVMPTNKADVFTLMNATLAVSQQTDKPLITMSMGQLGVISRVATASVGGSMSFGMVGQASAPGQIEVSELKRLLNSVKPYPVVSDFWYMDLGFKKSIVIEIVPASFKSNCVK